MKWQYWYFCRQNNTCNSSSKHRILIHQGNCYGSDEEQARTATGDAAEQKCHTHRCCNKMNEREMRKNAQNYVVHLWSRLHPREGKQRAFIITDAIHKWKLILNTEHPCLI